MAKKGTTKYQSNIQEKRVAKEVSGRTVIASGALSGLKGDVRTDNILVECKTTEKSFYRLPLSVWEKIRVEAIKDGLRIPVMCIDLENGKVKRAVFETGAFSHYNDYYEYASEETLWNDTKSTLISTEDRNYRVLFIAVTDNTKKSPCLEVISWENFLRILESGVKEECL